MEVTPRDDQILIRPNGRIISHRIDLGQYHLLGIVDRILTRTVNLWDTTEGVRVLYVFFLAGDEFAPFQVLAYCGSGLGLTSMRAHRLYVRVEGFFAPIKTF